MKSPVNNEAFEYIRSNLENVKHNDEYIINLFELAKKCNLFSSSQLINLVNEIENVQIRILIIAKVFPNVLDRSNCKEFNRNLTSDKEYISLLKIINSNYDSDLIHKDDKNYGLYTRCIKSLENDDLIFVKKLREKENLESKYDGKTTSNIGIDEDSISEKDLDRLINEMKNKKADKNLFKSIRSIIGIKTISTRNAIKLLKVLKEEYLLMELVIALYPCLNDPHNIEILINHILSSEKQNECRIRLIKLPNFYFDIVGEESQGACCCTIF